MNVTTGFSVPRQPAETFSAFRTVLEQMDEWELAGMYHQSYLSETVLNATLIAMERATYTSKSFLIALALVKKRITAEQAAQASHVEVNSQIEKWGEVEDCKHSSQSECSFSDIELCKAHDVDYHDVRRQLGSAACLLANHQL